MQVTGVTKEDGVACAQLINALARARFDGVTSKDAEALLQAKKWLHDLAICLSEQLKAGGVKASSASTPPASGFRVKSMGPLPGASSKKKKRK